MRLISFKSSSLKSLVFAYFLTYNPNLILSSLNLFYSALGENILFIDKNIPKIRIAAPCPISPNITPNKNGNVIIEKIDGFISL